MSSTSAGGAICTYPNPRPPLLRFLVPLSLAPGSALICLGVIVRGHPALLLSGLLILILAPFSLWLVDRLLRPTSVTLELDGVVLRFANGRRTSIPYEAIDARTVAPSPLSDNMTRGSIRNRDRGRAPYTVSGEIIQGIVSELKARRP